MNLKDITNNNELLQKDEIIINKETIIKDLENSMKY